MTSNYPDTAKNTKRRRLIVLAPLAAFILLTGFFLYALNVGDPSKLPSALIGKPVPNFQLPPVEGLMASQSKPVPGFANDDLTKGNVSVVNVWASWCVPCHAEHPFLSKLAQTAKVPLYGINYKDQPSDARRFLGKLGNPFTAVGADLSGRVGIDWGVYGVPETYVVDGNGLIVYKYVGPLNDKLIKDKILPAIKKANEYALPPSS